MATNCSLHLSRVPSAQNPADSTSRSLSLADSRLSDASWERLQVVFGGTNGHSVDLMALPSNDMFDFATAKLPFFSPHQALGCHGVNLFSQSPNLHPPLLSSNPYLFPPICLIANVPRFLFSVRVPFTIVVPDVQPRRFWWPLLPIVRHPVCLSHERVSLVLCAHPLRADFSIFSQSSRLFCL